MWREHGKYIASILVAIALVVFVVILMFGGSGEQKPANERKITDYISTDSTMEMTVYGPIVADENFQSTRISVSSSEVKIELMKGYGQNVVVGRTFINTGSAYNDFVRSLSIMNFDKGDTNEARADEKGFCPTGNRVTYVITENGSRKQRFWSATCTQGTFRGQAPQARALFRAQIPNYQAVVREVPNFTVNF